MPAKVPSFDFLQGVVQTGDAVQSGCVWCLHAGLTAPAENHVAYFYQGTSYCGPHLSEKVFNAQPS
jgi:hypothetical protein